MQMLNQFLVLRRINKKLSTVTKVKLLGHSLLKLLKKTFTNYSIVKEYETRLQKSNRNAAAATIWGAPPATGELM
jgi:hypothetical protein